MSKIKYPLVGYAPGNYQCKCATCGFTFLGDKQAVQCEPCATASLQEAYYSDLERIGELEKEMERLKALARNQFARTRPKPYDDDPEFNQYVKNNNL